MKTINQPINSYYKTPHFCKFFVLAFISKFAGMNSNFKLEKILIPVAYDIHNKYCT